MSGALTFSAKFGLAQSAASYQTASGTNRYHGDAFYINRNEFFDAQNYFNPKTPVDRQNNYGFTIAGPGTIPHLYNGKDRTFFHFSLDFAKQNITDIRIGTVPTALEKTGNFSEFVDGSGTLIPIHDPATDSPFPGNIIPDARISAVSRTVLPSMPNPDRAGLSSNKNYSHAQQYRSCPIGTAEYSRTRSNQRTHHVLKQLHPRNARPHAQSGIFSSFLPNTHARRLIRSEMLRNSTELEVLRP